ncbi:MAG: hypothetical protein KDD92_04300 [Caldilineaceae bacterium]|nr:hypothetical protein [Caldilineaceae bacterium]
MSLRRRFRLLPEWAALLILLLLALPALRPLWRVGLPATADGTLHLLRLTLLDEHVRAGALFPRWMPDLVLGYGYPLFNFYGPVAYYVAEALHLLGLSHTLALPATLGLFILIGGYGAYRLARDMFGAAAPALLAGVAYLYTPYLLTNVYMRGALAEAGAQALLPWIFWSFRRLSHGSRPAIYVLPAALSLGGLAATHNITLLWLPVTLLTYLAVPALAARTWRVLIWPAAGGLAALGVSAFFWLPLILERGSLSGVAFDIAAAYMSENAWTLDNFLDWHIPFDYTLSIPFQLGALQLGLALLGFGRLLLRRRMEQPNSAQTSPAPVWEWWYWLAVALIGMAGISRLALPLWMNSELLLIAQFPWRLLSIVSLPLALMTGGLLYRFPGYGWTGAGESNPPKESSGSRTGSLIYGLLTAALLALIVFTQRPQSDRLTPFLRAARDVTPAEVAQFEADTRAYGTSSSSEFLPRWAGPGLFAPQTSQSPNLPISNLQSPISNLTLLRASPFRAVYQLSAAEPVSLSFAGFYFPGWRAAVNDAAAPAYPEETRGLLTVDAPSGESEITLAWEDTNVERIANLISLLTLAGLTLLMLWVMRGRSRRALFWTLVPAALLGWGVAAARPLPPARPVQQPDASLLQDGITLLGTQVEQDGGYLIVRPTWLVAAGLPELHMVWTLVDAAGAGYALGESAPFYNTHDTRAWLPGMVMDDAYRLALPPALPSGDYTLELGLASAQSMGMTAVVASITLDASPPADSEPALPLDWRFGPAARLSGVTLTVNGRAADLSAGPPLVQPGDRLVYRLDWLADGPVTENYHGFLHLLDVKEEPILQGDQLPGPVISPPRLWNQYRAASDFYRFTVPEDAPSGLYRGAVGLYGFTDGVRLPVTAGDGVPLGDRGLLPPVKLINPPDFAPAVDVGATFANVATLEGYTLTPGAASADVVTVAPGETFTVTLGYRATGPTGADLTQFVHLYNPALGMADQRDARPGDGGNPTTAWTRDEVIVEEVPLTVDPTAPPGEYELLVGFYDPANNAARAPAVNAAGESLLNDQVPLARIAVEDRR